jgi:hypothetical protein
VDGTVYHGNLTYSNLSIQHSGDDETTGEAANSDEGKIFSQYGGALFATILARTKGKEPVGL